MVLQYLQAGRVDYLADLSFCPGPLLKPSEQIAENFCTSRSPIAFFVAMVFRFIVLPR